MIKKNTNFFNEYSYIFNFLNKTNFKYEYVFAPLYTLRRGDIPKREHLSHPIKAHPIRAQK